MDARAQVGSAIDSRWLLGLYLVIPGCLALVMVDSLVLGGALRGQLPGNPADWPFWALVFGLPHIVASMLTMADREYLEYYRARLRWPLLAFFAIVVAGQLGPQPVSGQVLFVFLAFYTIYHVLSQQLGLTLTMMGIRPTATFKAWKWLSIGTGFLIYILLFGSDLLDVQLGPVSLYRAVRWLTGAMALAMVVAALRLAPTAQRPRGRWYLWGNVAMLLSAGLSLKLGYAAFVIVIPRIIHDLTAYTVYVAHDSARNRDAPHNLVYRAVRFTGLPAAWLLPSISVGFAALLTLHQEWAPVNVAILTVTLTHYFIEGIIWRRPSPHRAQIRF